MNTPVPLRRLAHTPLDGQRICRVRYMRTSIDGIEQDSWDYGDWHWPGMAVEFATASGEAFYAAWGSVMTQFDLDFRGGSLEEGWQLGHGHEGPITVDVSHHPRWEPFVGQPLVRTAIVYFEVDASGVAPHALRIATSRASAWILSAEPSYKFAPWREAPLHTMDVNLEADEVLVTFGDDEVRLLGIPVGLVASR